MPAIAVPPIAIGDRRGHEGHAPADLRERVLLRQRVIEFAGQAAPVGELAQQDPARVADQAVPARGDRQGMAPPVTLHREGRPLAWKMRVVW